MSDSTAAATDCCSQPLLFQDLGSRKVVADFDGGHLSSDGGVLLVAQVDRAFGISRMLAGCFHDRRDARLVDHRLEELLSQRLHAMVLGYEDINDHDTLRRDPLLAVAAGKHDPLGKDRVQAKGHALAAPSTLNRLELSNCKTSRYHKISHDPGKVRDAVLELGLRCIPRDALELVLDLDLMGHLVHGLQEGRHFSAYYDGYCYQPLYVVCGTKVLWAQLRTGDADLDADVEAALDVILPALRRRCPRARIIVRGDCGFCRESVMQFCEEQKPPVHYVLGLGKNPVLEAKLKRPLAAAARQRERDGSASARRFKGFHYRTVKTWSRRRRVIGKAEVMEAGNNPRFVVTNLPAAGFEGEADSKERMAPQALYEKLYCGRGNMENVLKQQTLDLRADRMSTHHLASNQLRLWLATLAYVILERMRTLCLQGTELAAATAGTIRVRLLKVAASVRISVRRVHVRFCSAFPLQDVFRLAHARLSQLPAASG